jgi:hypothetical protein
MEKTKPFLLVDDAIEIQRRWREYPKSMRGVCPICASDTVKFHHVGKHYDMPQWTCERGHTWQGGR